MTPEQEIQQLRDQLSILERRVNDMQTTPSLSPDFLETIRGVLKGLSIGDFGDVEFSTLAGDEVLKYNGSTLKWENGTDDIGAL